MLLLTAGNMNDHNGAFLLFPALPHAKELLAGKGYDSDWFRAALTAQGNTPSCPQSPSQPTYAIGCNQ